MGLDGRRIDRHGRLNIIATARLLESLSRSGVHRMETRPAKLTLGDRIPFVLTATRDVRGVELARTFGISNYLF